MNGILENTSGDLKGPWRKPWLVIILLLIVLGGIAFYVISRVRRGGGEDAPIVEVVEPTPGDVDPHAPAVAPPARSGASVALPGDVARLRDEGKLIEASARAYELLAEPANDSMKASLEDMLGSINVELVLGPANTAEKIDYRIKSGDSLEKIARRYGTTTNTILEANKIADPNKIMIGYHITVFTGKFAVVVSKSRNELIVSMNGRFFKRYQVCTGKLNKTPAGEFVVATKETNPDWWVNGRRIEYTGDPKGENILGTRWMSLSVPGTKGQRTGYGIHGTWDDASIGKSESAGCIRMLNSDVEELFKYIPIGTHVLIEE